MSEFSEQEMRVLANVMRMIGSGNPTAQNLDDYIVGYEVLGRLVAVAQGDLEQCEMERRLAYAESFVEAKSGEEKVTDKVAEYKAEIATKELKAKEVKLHEKLTKIKHTREAVQEAIWGIKYLGRWAG